ncbi:MAG: hypothetical protein AB4426_15275 [Xenococcaceae cyanobacterium]
MVERILTGLKGVVRHTYLKISIVMAIIAIIGLATVGNYGISADESIGINMVYWNRDLITKGKPIPWLFKYDGTVFNFASEAIFQIYKRLRPKAKGSSNQLTDLKSRFTERIKVKHTLTFLTSLIAYISVAGIVGILWGLEYGWLGSVILALFPRFWGHSFFNFKDVPFASLFIFSTLMGAYLIDQYFRLDSKVKFEINRITVFSALYGVLVGLLTGIRFGGFLVLFFVLVAYLIIRLFRKGNLYRDFYNFGFCYVLIFISWLGTTIVCHPASWSNPIGWIFEIIGALSKYGWSGTVLFGSKFMSAQALPWYYLPTWIIITTPLIFQICFIAGLVVILAKYRKFSVIQRACVILMLFQVFFLPVMAIAKNSTMYDGLRHFLFILPVLAIISTTFLIWLYKVIVRRSLKIFLVAVVVTTFLQILLDMTTLHPYEYIYFNRISGGLERAHSHYETEYWGLSMREGMEWINQNANSNAKVIVGGPLHSASAFSDSGIKLISYKKSENINLEKPYYYLARPRWELPKNFPECRVVHQVVRHGVPLTIVKQCD